MKLTVEQLQAVETAAYESLSDAAAPKGRSPRILALVKACAALRADLTTEAIKADAAKRIEAVRK